MQFSSFLTSALMAAPLVLAAPIATPSKPTQTIKQGSSGKATIHNNCSFNITVNPCYNGFSEPVKSIAAGANWTHELLNFGGIGQGVSLKVASTEKHVSGVAQLEYTINDDMSVTFFDLSLIDGNPFGDYDQQVNNPAASIFCEAGVANCKAAYMTPSDNWANYGTAAGTDLDYYVCGGAPSDDDDDASTSSS